MALETWLEGERDQLILWLPVCLGGGVAAWFAIPDRGAWLAAILAALAGAAAALAAGRGGRAGVSLAIGCAAFAGGVALAWSRTEAVAAPVLARPAIVRVEARVIRADRLVARDLVRLEVQPVRWLTPPRGPRPWRFRVNVATAEAPPGIGAGALVRFRARLMPPPEPAVPGAYDFARVAWFRGLGATGRAFAPVALVEPGGGDGGLRVRLAAHVQARVAGSAGGIATALVTGDTGAIDDADAEAMRRAGLAHLLSVSGLHLTAVVGLTMLLVARLLALFPGIALRIRVPVAAALVAGVVAVGYTWLTGAEVPTVRSCIAALIVLGAIVAGRDAMTLRLVCAGAVIVLLLWPEALAGPSFQLSFAAITAIVALHEVPRVAAWFRARDEGLARRLLRHGASLLLTGLVVEAALMPIAMFHFHKAGLYGALANIVAIPLTTFLIMPLEALALALDPVGLGGPAWWLAERGLRGLLWLAHRVAAAPGAVWPLPAMPSGAFAALVIGGLWLALWRTRWRVLGLAPIAAGMLWAWTTPAPDLLVTGDGRHMALRTGETIALLRARAGDYARDTLAENAGLDGEPGWLDERREARCSRDLCVAGLTAGGRHWTIAATRSVYPVPIAALLAACRTADIVVSDRRLPRPCRPRWLKLDAPTLRATGGVAVSLATGRITTVLRPGDQHPWRAVLTARSGSAPDRAGGGRSRGERDRRAPRHPGTPPR